MLAVAALAATANVQTILESTSAEDTRTIARSKLPQWSSRSLQVLLWQLTVLAALSSLKAAAEITAC